MGDSPPDMLDVLSAAYSGGFYVASNFAREHATSTALAASCGWISSISPDGRSYGREWHITLEGHSKLLRLSRAQP